MRAYNRYPLLFTTVRYACYSENLNQCSQSEFHKCVAFHIAEIVTLWLCRFGVSLVYIVSIGISVLAHISQVCFTPEAERAGAARRGRVNKPLDANMNKPFLSFVLYFSLFGSGAKREERI